MSAELPMLRKDPVCPAALKIAGACGSQQGVVCRLMQADQKDDPGIDMTAGALGRVREGEGGVYLDLKSDPSSVIGFCHGDAIPVLYEDASARASYTVCPVWQAARDRHLAGQEGLYDAPVPEPVSMGVSSAEVAGASSVEAENPWAAARRGLDELAPVDPAAREIERIRSQRLSAYPRLG